MSLTSQTIRNPNKIQPEEKVQIARETNRLHLPREVVKWIQSLDLSYKIRSINRDLANGFCVAEILSRYPVPNIPKDSSPYTLNITNYYRVNMQEFSNGSSYSERSTNWKHITNILTKYYQMPISPEIPSKIINFAPNAAFEFLLVLYKFLTKKEANVLNKIDETNKFKQYAEMELLPKYMRPTASLLIRDTEVQRIKDDLIRKREVENILENHKGYLDKQREEFIKQKEYFKEKERLLQIQNNTKKLKGKSQDNQNNMNNTSSNLNNNSNEMNEGKESDNNVSGSERVKEEKVNLIGLLNDISPIMKENENVESEFRSLIKKNFIEADRNIELDLKNYSEEKDIIDYFFEKIDLCTEEHLTKIFSGYEDKEKDLIGIISRTLIELIPFIKIVCRFFDTFYKNGIPWIQFKTTTLKICNAVREIDGEKCDNVFLNFGLDIVLNMVKVNPIYRNEMCQIIFALTTNSSESHYEILKKISKKFANCDEVLFYHILVQCMNNIKETDEILNDNFFYFYNEAIIKGLSSSCDVIVIKSIYLINQFMRFYYFDCVQYYQKVFKHINSYNWEILSLILIYCSKMLELYNRQKIEREHALNAQENEINGIPDQVIKSNLLGDEESKQSEKEKSKISQKESQVSKKSSKDKKDTFEVKDSAEAKESIEIKEAKQESKQEESKKTIEQKEEAKVEEIDSNNSKKEIELIENKPLTPQSQINKKATTSDQGNLPQEDNEPQMDSKIENIAAIEKDPNIDDYNKKMEEDLKEIEKIEPKFLEIIDHIFSLPSPHMTIKIGFIYLAEVLEFYPELAQKYMKLLIEYKDSKIRKEVLNVNQAYEEFEYTISGFTERYQFCGAPKFWNQLVIAGIFRDYVKGNLDRFEAPHLLILHSIIIYQDFNDNDAQEWIALYNDLKTYIFVALCEKQYSNAAMSICNKIFSFEKILGELLDATFDLFILTMKHIYSDDLIDKPHENMKALLTFISELKSETNDCKGYVYKLIKTFAIQNDKKYLKSNLLDLMNSIYNEKRGKLFE